MKASLVLIVVFSLACADALFGQVVFQRTFGGKKTEDAYRVLQTADKGFICAGSTVSFGAGKSDMYVIKTDSIGNLLWAKAYGGTNNDYGHDMDRTKDGKFFVLGHSSSYTTEYNDICILKIDEAGNLIWAKSYGLDRSDYSNNIYTTKDGGFIVIGETINFLNHEKNSDILVIRGDKDGKVLWAKVYGGNNTDYAYSVQETKDGGFIIGGETNSYGSGEWDFYLLKLKQDGSVDWSRTYGESKTDYGRYAIEAPDGGFLMGGNTFNYKSKETDICIIKTDKRGQIEWSRTYGGIGTDYLLSMMMLDGDRFAATGYTNSYGTSVEDVFLMIFSLSGEGKVKCAKTFGSDKNDYGVSLDLTNDDGIVICGTTKSFDVGTEEEVYMVRTSQKWILEECNMKAMYPLNTYKVEPKSGTGHYDVELHCNESDIEVVTTTTETVQQILCTEE